ncbi:MAG: UPF0175 family protein [Nanoarchaeota archaeon]
MKTLLTTVRLPENIVKELDERAKNEGHDRTTVLREFLDEAIKNWKIEKAVRLYKEGKISVGLAAKIAGLTVGEIMDELIKRGIKSDLTVENYKESLAKAFKLFKLNKTKQTNQV